jgi:hypothetical protein
MRRLLVLSACLWILVGDVAIGHCAGAAGNVPSVAALFRRAGGIVRGRVQFLGASPLEANGRPSSGAATTAPEVDRWRFVFDNQRTPGSRFRTAIVRYKNGRFGHVTGKRPARLDDNRMSPLPEMTLDDAVARLRDAGFTQPFSTVTLRFPLGPSFSEPLFIFGFENGSSVGVGTTTGTVAPLSASALS